MHVIFTCFPTIMQEKLHSRMNRSPTIDVSWPIQNICLTVEARPIHPAAWTPSERHSSWRTQQSECDSFRKLTSTYLMNLKSKWWHAMP